MGLAKTKDYISVEDYLEGEKVSEIKHEYINGEVYPMYNEVGMAGTSDSHNRIAGRLFARLLNKLDDSNCEVFIQSMKLQTDEKTFYYPDVFVACDKANRYFRQEPILIIEVLSPSTERIDKNEKLNVYRQISKMLEYLIVSQNKVRIELCRKQLNGNWTKEVFTKAEEVLQLESVDLSFNLAEIYRGITFDE